MRRDESWKGLTKVKVAEWRKAEICSVRKNDGGVWMLADILALLTVVGCVVLVWKDEWQVEGVGRLMPGGSKLEAGRR